MKTFQMTIEVENRKLTCARCRYETALQPLQINHPTYGGFKEPFWRVSSWRNPEGWTRFDNLDLCASCTNSLKKVVIGI